MDDPAIDPAEHERALRQLARLNLVSRTVHSLFVPIRRLALSRKLQPVRVLDLACGAGDIARGLQRRLVRAGLPAEVAGCDLSETAVNHAAERSPGVHFFRLDALNDALPADYDAITCCLFLHHLDEAQTVGLLNRMGQAARHLVLISDLRRSRFNLALTYAATRVLSRSSVVRHDAMVSMRAAYTIKEVCTLAQAAGLGAARVRRHWAARFLLSWERSYGSH